MREATNHEGATMARQSSIVYASKTTIREYVGTCSDTVADNLRGGTRACGRDSVVTDIDADTKDRTGRCVHHLTPYERDVFLGA